MTGPIAAVDASAPAAVRKGTLEERAKAIKAELRDARVGPLRAALALVDLFSDWSAYRAEAGDLDPDAWADVAFGFRGAAGYFRRRAEAVGVIVALGWTQPWVLSRFDHEVAVYLAGDSISDPHRKAAINAVLEAQKTRRTIVSVTIARDLVGDVVGRKTQRQGAAYKLRVALAHIDALRAAVAKGEPLPPLPVELAT